MSSLPILPTDLQILFCFSNKLTSLPPFPNNLTTVYCFNNLFTCLPSLSNSLKSLYLDADRVTCLLNTVTGLKVYNATGDLITTPPICIVIPDPNFAAAIRISCPTCIGNCNNLLPPSAALTYLDISNKNISNLSGIEGFKNLQNLFCSNNKLSSLPTLPANLTYINCSSNLLRTLPILPNKLVTLYCDNNQLVCLPSLPKTLRSLSIYNNNITCLPNKVNGLSVSTNSSTPLPLCGVADENFAKAIQEICPNCIDSCYKLLPPAANLTTLDVRNKNITDLTGIAAFTSLQTLNCANNLLTCLPTLPATLNTLQIDHDKVKCLPNTLSGLQVYNAAGNLIPTPPLCEGNIPDPNFAEAIRNVCPTCIDVCNNLLPPAKTLTSFYISSKNITNLTGIAGFTALTTLYCSSNKLTTLPELPASLTYLDCRYNQLTCFPTLPITLTTLYIDADKITCLPNLVAGLKVYDKNYNLITTPPLCPVTLTHSSGTLAKGTYVATQTIESTATLSIGLTNYHAGQSITLYPGFQTSTGSTFLVQIRGCK
ncbi:MAG: leucine-rich repeat domain-containing protein [Spirosomataceae bacterium]